jgi:hypothetical protein
LAKRNQYSNSTTDRGRIDEAEREGRGKTDREWRRNQFELIQKKVTGLIANREGTGLIKNRGG